METTKQELVKKDEQLQENKTKSIKIRDLANKYKKLYLEQQEKAKKANQEGAVANTPKADM